MEWGLRRQGGVQVRGSALTADVCVGRQAVAEQLHVPSGGIHASLGAQLPCQTARSARSDPSSPLEPTLTLLSPRGSSAPWKGSPSQAPPWRERLPNFVADLGPGWGSLPLGADAPALEGRGSEPQEAPSPGGFPKRGPLSPSGNRDEGERRGRLPYSLGGLREGKPPPSPIPPAPRGPPGPEARAHSPSAPRFPAARPRRVRRPQTPGARPLPPRPVPVTCPPGSDPRPRQRGPDKGRWTSRRKVSSEERGGTGRGGAGEAGRKRAGRGRGEEGCREEGWGGAEA